MSAKTPLIKQPSQKKQLSQIEQLSQIKNLYKTLVKNKKISFPQPGGQLEAPEEKGVYLIFNQKGKVVHVGCTPRAQRGIKQRLENHLSGTSSFVKKFKPLGREGSKLRGKYKFSYVVVPMDVFACS